MREEEGEGKRGKERVKDGDEGDKCVWEEELQDRRRVRDTGGKGQGGWERREGQWKEAYLEGISVMEAP